MLAMVAAVAEGCSSHHNGTPAAKTSLKSSTTSGPSKTTKAPAVFDGPKVASEIEHSADGQSLGFLDLTCPTVQQVKVGSTFTCNGDIRIQIKVTSKDGHYRWRPLPSKTTLSGRPASSGGLGDYVVVSKSSTRVIVHAVKDSGPPTGNALPIYNILSAHHVDASYLQVDIDNTASTDSGFVSDIRITTTTGKTLLFQEAFLAVGEAVTDGSRRTIADYNRGVDLYNRISDIEPVDSGSKLYGAVYVCTEPDHNSTIKYMTVDRDLAQKQN